MIELIRLPMFPRKNGMIGLQNFLDQVPDNDFTWSVLEFYGIGQTGLGMTMPDFEEFVRSEPAGLRISWHDLCAFTSRVEQTYDCLIIATSTEADIVPAELAADNFERCLVVLQARDSTDWLVGIDSQISGMEDVLACWMTFDGK